MSGQVTWAPRGRILTNCNVWSPDGEWIVYDTRSDTYGTDFDGTRIVTVHVDSGDVRVLYESRNGACCGVATFSPTHPEVVFILGPEYPTPDWEYGPTHRQGVLVEIDGRGIARNLDARDLMPPGTPGALRGGSHVHVFSPDGAWISFTYNDAILANFSEATEINDVDQRNVAVGVPDKPVEVSPGHPRNASGTFFSVLATRTCSHPRPGSDDILVAQEEGWIGTNGYVRADGTRQPRALAFGGTVLATDGSPLTEVFVADLPDDIARPSPDGPLQGTPTRRPTPPFGTVQRRITHTEGRKFPGLAPPRHWLRGSPDGTEIAFLMRDDEGIVQIWAVSPNGGSPRPVTRGPWGVASAFTFSPDGLWVAYAADNSVFTVEFTTGRSRRLTPRASDADAPLPLAVVFSPDGSRIAYLRNVADNGADGPRSNQIFVVAADSGTFGTRDSMVPKDV